MKATAKQIFSEIQTLKPIVSTVSSLGSFVTEFNQSVSDMVARNLMVFIPENTLAYKIISTSTRFTDKQLWVIAFELEKNEDYATELGEKLAIENDREEAKRQESKSKLANNKADTQNVLDYVKENGKLLKDYYSFLKSSKQYKKEFFSKKFTMESANEFLNK
mgnify:FL=1|jgi:hypothetical protein